jgi:hypothetical protein
MLHLGFGDGPSRYWILTYPGSIGNPAAFFIRCGGRSGLDLQESDTGNSYSETLSHFILLIL